MDMTTIIPKKTNLWRFKIHVGPGCLSNNFPTSSSIPEKFHMYNYEINHDRFIRFLIKNYRHILSASSPNFVFSFKLKKNVPLAESMFTSLRLFKHGK